VFHTRISDRFRPTRRFDWSTRQQPAAHGDRLHAGRVWTSSSAGASSIEIEREALRKETDEASKARLEILERELAETGEEAAAMKSRWGTEKAAIAAVRATKPRFEALQVRIEQAERERLRHCAAQVRSCRATGSQKEGRPASPRSPVRIDCSRKRSPPTTSPGSWRPGPACR